MYKTYISDDMCGISELITEQRYREELDRFRSLFIYRGMSDSSQFSFFSVIPSDMDDIEEFLWKYTNNTVRFIIKKELRWQARDLLDHLNISERIIYPGLDGLSRWLERHYYVKEDHSG